MRNNLAIALFSGLFIMIFALVAGLPASAQDAALPVLDIVSGPLVEADVISLDFTLQDERSASVIGLTADDLAIGEAAADVQLASATTRPIALAVIVNLSNGSDVDLIRDTLRAYFANFYNPDDLIVFYILGTETDTSLARVVEPVGLDEINTLIDSLSRSDAFYTIGDTLTASLLRLRAAKDENPIRSQHVLFVGSFLFDIREDGASRIFPSADIPFHVVQAHRTRQQATELYRSLASLGNGQFAVNVAGSLVNREDNFAPIGSLRLLYQTISSNRTVYTLSYRTISQDVEPQRDVALTVTLPDGSEATTNFVYEKVFQPPTLTIAAATDLNPVRNPELGANDALLFDVAEQSIRLRVAFPDGVPRDIQAIRLEVRDSATGSILQSPLSLAPEQDADGNYVIPWSLQAFDTPETTNNVQLIITATDALNLEGVLTHDATVTVSAVPLPPTPTIAPTSAPGVQPVSQGDPATINTLTLAVLIAVIAILVLVVLILIVALVRAGRRKTSYPDTFSDEFSTDPSLDPNEPLGLEEEFEAPGQPDTIATDSKIFGRLVVLEGLPETEIILDSPQFIIGRTLESGCNYAIDKPFISPQHCKLIFHNGHFSIQDMGSKNGTFVNGERVLRRREITIPLESIVEITKNISLKLYDADSIAPELQDAEAEAQRSGRQLGEAIPNPVRMLTLDEDDSENWDEYKPI